MIFPIVQPKVHPQRSELPVYRDVGWDWQRNCHLWLDGQPVIVEKQEAVAAWAMGALITQRCRYPIYTQAYGCELEELIGSGFAPTTLQAEAERMVKECLLVSPYITEVREIAVGLNENVLTIACKLVTEYGEVSIHVV